METHASHASALGPKIKPLGPLAAAGECVTDGRKEGKLGNI